ncbi:MAG TPA: DNA-directed RNA polymerase subunit alpha [Patescibacteria group bacterium]|nr:DNA-directed RNA polymerase subunit alpha [Patescibacteria group bacterium]
MDELNFTIKELTATQDFGEFVIEPLEPGYGHTLGNALRRVLYVSIPGAAVTSVKINGVKHRFSTVNGLKENVVDLLLNIKQLQLRLGDSKDIATLKLSARGQKEVTGADLTVTDGVEVVNKDQYLGALTGEKAKLDIELTVERGMGFSPADERKTTTLGVIPTDAIFSPVRRVTYSVESTRVGRQTNLDKLVLKIWTNGSVTPREALDFAAKVLSRLFTQIYEPKKDGAIEAPIAISNIPAETLRMTIDELDLPTRIYNSLRNGGIETVEQLLQAPRKELVSMRNMGGKSIAVIEEKLQEKGISLPA